jgi:hypothetical protein
MAGSLINTYTQLDTDILALQLTSDANFVGKHNVSLTNYNTTGLPAIAAGSIVECNGALYEFTSEEAITGSPSNGTVYIQIVPDTTTCTAAFTNTAPTWSDAKQGFYGTDAAANYRYLEFKMTKLITSYGNKQRITYDDNLSIDHLTANTITATTITATDLNVTDDLTLGDNLTLSTGSVVTGGLIQSALLVRQRYTSGSYQSENTIYDTIAPDLITGYGYEYSAHGILHQYEAPYYVHILSVAGYSGFIRIKGIRSDTYDSITMELYDSGILTYKLNMVY